MKPATNQGYGEGVDVTEDKQPAGEPTPSGEAPAEEEIERRLAERPDLLERFAKGDASALAKLIEVGTGAHVDSHYRLPEDLHELPRLLDVEPHVTELLGVSRNTVYRLIANNDIPSVRVGMRVLKVPRDQLLRQFGLLEDRGGDQ